MSIEAMKQALEALEIYGAHAGMCDQLVLLTSNPPMRKPCSCGLHKAITALRQAIAEAEKQEPVACANCDELSKALALAIDRKSTRLNSSHVALSRMPSSS